MLHQLEPRYQTKSTKDITILSEKHCWRTLGGVSTNDFLMAQQAVVDGCHLQQAEFVLRHPEAMLCDLSNVEGLLAKCPTSVIENVFDDLARKVSQLTDSSPVRAIRGDDLAPEIAISGPSKRVLDDWKKQFIESAFSANDVSKHATASSWNARGIARETLLIAAKQSTLDLYNKCSSFYSQFIHPGHWDTTSMFNLRTIYDDHAVWGDINNLGENKMFILTAGLQLGLGYVNATNDKNVYFTEVHRQNDASLMQKNKHFDGVFPNSGNPKSWVVIDKAYSGGSIKYAKKLLQKKFGNAVNIVTVAMFPKSLEAFASADYSVYGGRLIRAKDVLRMLQAKDWHRDLLKMGVN